MTELFRPGEYYRPSNLGEATRLLSSLGKKAKIIAGGTDLLVNKPSEVQCLVDVVNLDLDYIRKVEQGIEIGAATTVDLIGSSSILSSEPYVVLSEAASMLGTPTVRNMATIGGNICNASPAADLPLALMVLDASAKIIGSNGSRMIPIGDLFEGLKKTRLGEDELLVGVHIPAGKETSGTSFQKLRHHQTSIDIAIVNAATRLTCENETCKEARIALGAVAATPIYAEKAEATLINKRLDPDIIQRAAEAASEGVDPIDDVRASAGYRKRMVAILVKRALEHSARRCGIWKK